MEGEMALFKMPLAEQVPFKATSYRSDPVYGGFLSTVPA